MHALDFGTVHEDLRERPWFGQAVKRLGVQLDGDVVGVGGAFRVFLALTRQMLQRVGAPCREDRIVHPPEDAILIQAFDRFQRRFDLLALRGTGVLVALVLRVVTREDGVEQEFGDGLVLHQGAGDQLLAEGDARLLQVARIGAQPAHAIGRDRRTQDERVEAVVVRPAAPHLLERGFEIARPSGTHVQGFAVLRAHRHVVHENGIAARVKLEGALGLDREAHVL